MSGIKLFSTGVKELDEILGGGYYPGYIVLIAGHPGAGKTTLGASFLYKGALEREAGIYVSLAERKNEFFRHMKPLGMDFQPLEEKGLFKFMDFPTLNTRDVLSTLITTLGEETNRLKAKRIVIDPITAFIDIVGKEEARAFLHSTLLKLTKPLGVVTYLIADLPLGVEVIGHGFEEFLADAVLKLVIDKKAGLVRRKLIIHKAREVPMVFYEYEFIIEQGGIRIYPKMPRAIKGSYTLERIESGIEGLDRMLHGGFLKGSSVLITGPSGTGKTLILLTIALYNASKGRRVLYISLEESVEQLRTTARTLEFNVDELESKKLINFITIGPGTLTPEGVYHRILDAIKNLSPSILILDGLSSLERLFGESDFMLLGRNIIIEAKKRGILNISSMLHDVMAGREVGMSTMTDSIIALWFDISSSPIKRMITVLKMRGSPHDTSKKILAQVNGKVVIK